MVSSVNLFSMDLVVDGRPQRAAQLSGVGTLTTFRRRGLNRELTERALEWAIPSHDFVYLFADEDARPFYLATGFSPTAERQPFIAVEGLERRSGMRRLDMTDAAERQILADLATGRAPVSEKLGAQNPKLLMFSALYPLRERFYHLAELDVAVAYATEGQRLTLFDVVGSRGPSWDQIWPYLASPEIREVQFGFIPDRLAPPDLRWRPCAADSLFDRQDIPLRGVPFLFPYTSHA